MKTLGHVFNLRHIAVVADSVSASTLSRHISYFIIRSLVALNHGMPQSDRVRIFYLWARTTM